VGLLRAFASGGGVWAYSEEMSGEHAKSLSGPACIIEWMGSDAPRKPIIAFSASDGDCRTLNLDTIGVSTTDEYNLVAACFAGDLRRWAKQTGDDIRVKLGRADVGLEELIPSKKARDLFVGYLEACRWDGRFSSHPSDLKLLDLFTCAIHTYSRKPVDLCELERYLEEDCMWPRADSQRCVGRVDIGLHVLRLACPRRCDLRPCSPAELERWLAARQQSRASSKSGRESGG